ncbi:acyltransferase family protein [Jiangella endophytica]|uniref:acyltransferase family protein n=1 Tax=Jiangella endophytica TaxID=1623398 RepID=UPI000E355E46|nr:acyltransferase [Jiangella endophytica]
MTAGAQPDAPGSGSGSARDRLVDAVRAASLAVVVLGHWLMASVSVSADGRVIPENALAELTALRPATWVLQVMPLFFMAGGFANLTVWRRTVAAGGGHVAFVRSRLTRLWRPVPWFLPAVPLIGLAAFAAGLPTGGAVRLAVLLLQPLWFLAVYTGIIAIAPVLLRWHSAAPRTVLAGLVVGAMVVDAVRLTGGPSGVTAANLALVWLFAHHLGVWYGDGRFAAVARRRLWVVLTAAVVALVLLTGPGPYPVSMVGLPGQLSNMSPPTVCVLVLSIGQGAAMLLARRRLERWLRRPGPWAAVVRFGSVAMTVYLWHLLVLVVAFGALLATGQVPPQPGSMTWWLTRPPWLMALTMVLAAVAVLMARLRGASRRANRRANR